MCIPTLWFLFARPPRRVHLESRFPPVPRRNAHLLQLKSKATRVSKRVLAVQMNRKRAARQVLINSMQREAEASVRRFTNLRDTMDRLGGHHARVERILLSKLQTDIEGVAELSNRVQAKQNSTANRRGTLLQRRIDAANAAVAKARQVHDQVSIAERKKREEMLNTLRRRLEGATERRMLHLSLLASTPGAPARSPAGIFAGMPVVTASWTIE